MTDQEVRLDQLLSDLEAGHISTADAAHQLRTMTFPAPTRKTAAQLREDTALPEAEVPEPGSFFAVSQAYASGRITRRQYEALQQAAADAIRAHPGTAAGKEPKPDVQALTLPE